ncbi:hypothetical protein [Sneathiella sp.]|uniref:hypothetical protein n=1 Tax=Sneathiella sp. TaxID=1964365 RepID=UPI00263131E1|nr:hypothetical protein [Sneathiella sp.]MDF2366057.1 hypothetical protein [Sneathiella sp.]
MPKILITLLLLTLSMMLQTTAFADNTDAYFQPVEIHDAIVTISNQDTSGDLRFRIVNDSPGKLTIVGVTNTDNVQSKIMGRIDANNYTELGSITLLREENLDLTTTHIFIRLSNFREPLEIGQIIELKLVLSNGELPFSAHVNR